MRRLALVSWLHSAIFFASHLLAQTNYLARIVQPDPLQTPTICMVSVTPENKNIIVWEKPVITFIDSFRIYRESTLQTDQWDLIGAIAYLSASVYLDSTAEPSNQSYKYKISSLDACGNETPLSQEHKTINLSVLKGVNNTWSLIWDQYIGFIVSNYKIYRGTSIDNMQLIGSATTGNFNYNDLQAPEGVLFYQIEVTCPNNCYPTKQRSFKSYTSSWSNIASNNTSSGIKELSQESYLKVFPNPAKNIVAISFPNSQHQLYSIKLYDLAGKDIMSSSTYDEKFEIQVRPYANGLYIIEVFGPGIYRSKLVINGNN